MKTPVTALPSHTPTVQAQGFDAWSVACIALVAYLVAAVIHEGVGHGLVAVLLGAQNLRLSTAALHLDSRSLSDGASRLVSMAGPLVGFVAGCLFAWWQIHTRSRNAEFRYFLWLTASVCLFANSGYLMALSFVRFGDIDGFLHGVKGAFWYRLGLTLAGTGLYVATVFFAGWTLDPFLGRSRRRTRAAKLLLTSYLVGSGSLILSTCLGQEGLYLALVSALPATLGGTAGLVYTIFAVGGPRPSTDPNPLTPRRSLVWYAAGGVAVLLDGLVLGPGVPR
jgi:hypothetical protein